jgi:hypothetical protein
MPCELTTDLCGTAHTEYGRLFVLDVVRSSKGNDSRRRGAYLKSKVSFPMQGSCFRKWMIRNGSGHVKLTPGDVVSKSFKLSKDNPSVAVERLAWSILTLVCPGSDLDSHRGAVPLIPCLHAILDARVVLSFAHNAAFRRERERDLMIDLVESVGAGNDTDIRRRGPAFRKTISHLHSTHPAISQTSRVPIDRTEDD